MVKCWVLTEVVCKYTNGTTPSGGINHKLGGQGRQNITPPFLYLKRSLKMFGFSQEGKACLIWKHYVYFYMDSNFLHESLRW